MLARGARLMQLLKQPQYSPMHVEEQVFVIYAGTKGYLDNIDIDQIGDYESRLLDDIRANASDIIDVLREEKRIDDSLDEKMSKFLDVFTKSFSATKKAA